MVVMMLMVVVMIMAAAVMVVVMLVMMVLMLIVVVVVMLMVMFMLVIMVVIVTMLMLVVMVMTADRTDVLMQQLSERVGQRIAALHRLQDLFARQLIPRGGDDRRGRILLADERQHRLASVWLSTIAPA